MSKRKISTPKRSPTRAAQLLTDILFPVRCKRKREKPAHVPNPVSHKYDYKQDENKTVARVVIKTQNHTRMFVYRPHLVLFNASLPKTQKNPSPPFYLLSVGNSTPLSLSCASGLHVFRRSFSSSVSLLSRSSSNRGFSPYKESSLRSSS